MAVSHLPMVPSLEHELYRKSQSLGIVQLEKNVLPEWSKFKRSQLENKQPQTTAQETTQSGSLPVIKHPLSMRKLPKQFERELTGYDMYSFTSIAPKRDTVNENNLEMAEENSVVLPLMRSRTLVDSFPARKTHSKTMKLKNPYFPMISKSKSTLDTLYQQVKNELQRQELIKSPEPVRIIVSPTSKYDMKSRPVDYYTKKHPMVVLDEEMQKLRFGKEKKRGFHRQYKGVPELGRSKTELLPVEKTIEHCKERIKPIKTVSGWMTGLFCNQKKLHRRRNDSKKESSKKDTHKKKNKK